MKRLGLQTGSKGGSESDKLHADDASFLRLLSKLLEDEVQDEKVYSARDVSAIVRKLQERVGAHLVAIRKCEKGRYEEGGGADGEAGQVERKSPRITSLYVLGEFVGRGTS